MKKHSDGINSLDKSLVGMSSGVLINGGPNKQVAGPLVKSNKRGGGGEVVGISGGLEILIK